MIPLIELPPAPRGSRVAFFGPMCSGKTYLANYLGRHHDYFKLGFATKLKSLVKDIFDVEGKDQESRRILQNFADDCKKYDPLIFTKHFLLNAGWHDRIVCDDMRFVQEADILHKNGFVLVRVHCDENIRQQRIDSLYGYSDNTLHQHSSEQEWAKIEPDLIIDSNKPDDVENMLQKIWESAVSV